MKIVLFLFLILGLWGQSAGSRVRVETSVGDFTVEVHPDWAPLGAARFEELVRARYFDDSRFFRIVAGKWAQFGIAGDPRVAREWRGRTIGDDILRQSNT